MTSQGFKIKRNLLNKAKQEYQAMQYTPTGDVEEKLIDVDNSVEKDILSEFSLRLIIRESINKILFESPLSHMEKPGSEGLTNADKFASSGRSIGYSPIQDIDKVIEPIILSGLTIFPPTSLVATAYTGAAGAVALTKDILDIYTKKIDEKQKKKEMYRFIKEKGLEKIVSALPVGKFPGTKSFTSKLSSSSFDIVESAYQMMIDAVKQHGVKQAKIAMNSN